MSLADSRAVRISGTTVARTPLLLPSYSSCAIEDGGLGEVVQRTVGIILGSVLISAYDLHANAFEGAKSRDGRPVFDIPLTFIDSGGYEVFKKGDLDWTRERHEETLQGWPADANTVVVGYDTPDEDLGVQLQSVLNFLADRHVGRTLLLKPVPGAASPRDRGSMHGLIDQLPLHADQLSGVDVIGLTEKEAGSSLRARLGTIAHLRRTLDRIGSTLPIHLFGGLDPLLTPMFFLAGADIFDGLSWLRYAFVDGQAHYLEPTAALAHPDLAVSEAKWLVRRRNYSEIARMDVNLKRYISVQEPELLHPNGRQMMQDLMQSGVLRD